jgi:hypothetical protein
MGAKRRKKRQLMGKMHFEFVHRPKKDKALLGYHNHPAGYIQQKERKRKTNSKPIQLNKCPTIHKITSA